MLKRLVTTYMNHSKTELLEEKQGLKCHENHLISQKHLWVVVNESAYAKNLKVIEQLQLYIEQAFTTLIVVLSYAIKCVLSTLRQWINEVGKILNTETIVL